MAPNGGFVLFCFVSFCQYFFVFSFLWVYECPHCRWVLPAAMSWRTPVWWTALTADCRDCYRTDNIHCVFADNDPTCSELHFHPFHPRVTEAWRLWINARGFALRCSPVKGWIINWRQLDPKGGPKDLLKWSWIWITVYVNVLVLYCTRSKP